MEFTAGRAENMLDLDSSRRQSIGDQGPMTLPRDSFGAYDRGGHRRCKVRQPGQALTEGVRLHVVRVASKVGVFPTGIDGVFARVAEASKSGQMRVLDSAVLQ